MSNNGTHVGERLSAAGCVLEDLASLSHADRTKLGNHASKRTARQGVEVVEASDTCGGHAVVFGCQFQFRHHTTTGPGQRGYDNRTNTIGSRVPGENQNWSVATRSSRKPNLTPLHRPNLTNPRQDPNQRFVQ